MVSPVAFAEDADGGSVLVAAIGIKYLEDLGESVGLDSAGPRPGAPVTVAAGNRFSR